MARVKGMYLTFQEMESYISHIRELAEERAGQLESEAIVLRSKLESSQQQAATLAALLEQNGFQTGNSDESLGEQVSKTMVLIIIFNLCLFIFKYLSSIK